MRNALNTHPNPAATNRAATASRAHSSNRWQLTTPPDGRGNTPPAPNIQCPALKNEIMMYLFLLLKRGVPELGGTEIFFQKQQKLLTFDLTSLSANLTNLTPKDSISFVFLCHIRSCSHGLPRHQFQWPNSALDNKNQQYICLLVSAAKIDILISYF